MQQIFYDFSTWFLFIIAYLVSEVSTDTPLDQGWAGGCHWNTTHAHTQ